MENSPESFEALQRLLSLKRHEVPPPRFFDELPSRIMGRIESRPTGGWVTMLDRLFELAWFRVAAGTAMTMLVGTLLTLAVRDAGSSSSGGGVSADLLPAAGQSFRGVGTNGNGPSLQPVVPPYLRDFSR